MRNLTPRAGHMCPGDNCRVCEDRAERARDGADFDEEHAIRQAERRYEAQLFGRGQ